MYPLLYKIGINTPLRKITLGGILVACAFVCAAIVQFVILVSIIPINNNDYVKIILPYIKKIKLESIIFYIYCT